MNKLFPRALAIAAVPMGGFALFYILPYIFVLRYSFTGTEIGFSNYQSVLENEYFRRALVNTALFILISLPVILILSYILSDMAVRNRFGMLFLAVLFVPTLIPSISASNIWQELFDEVGIEQIILLFVWKNTGLASLVMTAGRMRISQEVFDAAAIDGAGGLTLHHSIILPMMTPVIFFSSLVMLVQSFKIFREIYLLYSSYPPDELYMIPHYIFNKFNKLDYGELAAGSVIFTCMIVALLAAVGAGMLIHTKGKWYREKKH